LGVLLLGSVPDDRLLDGSRGSLADANARRAAGEALLASAPGRQVMPRFWRRLLRYDTPRAVDPTLWKWMADSADAFVADVMASDARLETLLTSPNAFVGGPLTSVFDVAGPTDALARTALDPKRRAGLVTHPAVLAPFRVNGLLPTTRGFFLADRLLCTSVPPEPLVGFARPQPSADPALTPREQLEELVQSSSGGACRACHAYATPLGYALDHYDAVGRWRDDEAGQPIDASADLRTRYDLRCVVDGGPSLARGLVDSERVRACVPSQWLRYVFQTDAGELTDFGSDPERTLQDRFRAAGDLRDLVLTTLQLTPVRSTAPQTPCAGAPALPPLPSNASEATQRRWTVAAAVLESTNELASAAQCRTAMSYAQLYAARLAPLP
jgi:hypothetical protein